MRTFAQHTDGIGWVQLMTSLRRGGVWERLLVARDAVPLSRLVAETGANLGYLNVALRVLEAQGWVERRLRPQPEATLAALTPLGHSLDALSRDDVLERVNAFAPVACHMREYLLGSFAPPEGSCLEALHEWSRAGWRLMRRGAGPHAEAARRLRLALDGNLVAPVAVALKHDFAHLIEGESITHSKEFPGPQQRWLAALEVLSHAGWLERRQSDYAFTPHGAHAFSRASSYGVPLSYLPLFQRVHELLFGDAQAVWSRGSGDDEHLVDRVLNVTASGATHQKYFRAADGIICEAFNRPFPEQPLGFCDMGCGDGAWLGHVWKLIYEQTERGRLMKAHPGEERYRPLMVGADFNQEALETARAQLERAGVPALVLQGDINDPARLAADLNALGIDARELLHANSFLVHNRPYEAPRQPAAKSSSKPPRHGAFEGAYAWRTQAVSNADLERNLVEFMQRWRQVVGRHGFLVIELHDPETVVVGRTLTNYIMTHGFSNQFTVTIRAFLEATREAGFVLDTDTHRSFPSDPACATVSVNHFFLGTSLAAGTGSRPASGAL